MNEKDLEALQKKARIRERFVVFFSVAVFLLTAAGLFFSIWFNLEDKTYLTEVLAEFIAAVIVLPAMLAFGIYFLFHFLIVKGPYERFDQAFKNTYVLQTVQAAGNFENLRYASKGGLTYNEIRDSLVVNCGEQKYYKSEDLLTGTVYSIPFSYCDVVTQYLKRRGKKSEVRTIFEGQVMRFSLPEHSKWSFGHLQIIEKGSLSNQGGRRAAYEIRTENEAFNQRFEVFAADEHNAFYFLTPQMLEQIIGFADFSGCQIAITFVGAVLYVAIYRSHSMFNASVSQPFSQQRQLILSDANLLKQAAEILIFGANVLTQQEGG